MRTIQYLLTRGLCSKAVNNADCTLYNNGRFTFVLLGIICLMALANFIHQKSFLKLHNGPWGTLYTEPNILTGLKIRLYLMLKNEMFKSDSKNYSEIENVSWIHV